MILSGVLGYPCRIDFVLRDKHGDPGVSGLDDLPGMVAYVTAVHGETVAEYVKEAVAFEAEFHAALVQDEIKDALVPECGNVGGAEFGYAGAAADDVDISQGFGIIV